MNITPFSRKLYDELAAGWNTWDVNSVTSQVLLPDKIRINLAFIIPDRCGYSGNSCWDEVEDFGDHSIDGSYTSIDIKYLEGRWRIETSADGDEMVIRVTPLEKRPGGPVFLAVEAGGIWGKQADILHTADGMSLASDGKTHHIRSLSGIETTKWDPSCVPHFCIAADKTVYLCVNCLKTAEQIDSMLLKAHENWAGTSIHADGELGEAIGAMKRSLLWNMVYDSHNARVVTPVSRAWCRTRGHLFGDYVLFDWDTFFAALQYALIDKRLAYSTFFSILEEVTPEGMIPNFGCATGPSRDRSEPQVGSLCALKLYAQFGDKEFLDSVFDILYSWNNWRFANRDKNGDGLFELGSDVLELDYEAAHSCGETGTKQAAQYESGIDNSTMFDKAVFNEDLHCLEQSYMGLNALMSMDCELLARIADITGRVKEAEILRSRCEKLNSLINSELWNEELGIYLNRNWDGSFDKTLSLTHFYAMLTCALPSDRQKALMRHLTDPNEFWGEYVIPNIARCDPSFYDQTYWRGRIWAPTNFLVGEGLLRYGETETWNELSDKGLSMFVKCWKEKHAVGENYNAITGMAADFGPSDRFYHWGALLAYMAVQKYINFDEWNLETIMHEAGSQRIMNIPVRDTLIDIK